MDGTGLNDRASTHYQCCQSDSDSERLGQPTRVTLLRALSHLAVAARFPKGRVTMYRSPPPLKANDLKRARKFIRLPVVRRGVTGGHLLLSLSPFSHTFSPLPLISPFFSLPFFSLAHYFPAWVVWVIQ